MALFGICGIRPYGRVIGIRFSPGALIIHSSSHCSLPSRLWRRKFSTSWATSPLPKSPRETVGAKSKKSTEKQKVIVISGPTGTGKSRLALELAKKLNGEIVSADSVQVYRGLDVGSAKPSPSDRKEVPHHLIDILDPSEEYSVGRFFEDAREATTRILSANRVPIVTGGTGLYLRWFVYGKPDVPKASLQSASAADAELSHLEDIGDWSSAVELLVKAGDLNAHNLTTNDWYRLRRRLEVIKSSGSPPSSFPMPYEYFKEQLVSRGIEQSHNVNSSAFKSEKTTLEELDYEFKCFFLSSQRVDLYRSIDVRCEDMCYGSEGILREASWLLESGLLPNLNSATRAIGYRQAMEYLLKCQHQGGKSSSSEFFSFLADFQKESRNFAKRQMTWFRSELMYRWLDASRPMEELVSFIHDSYNDETGTLVVPVSLRMEKNVANPRVKNELKTYATINRHFRKAEDCKDILEWIGKTQSGATALKSP